MFGPKSKHFCPCRPRLAYQSQRTMRRRDRGETQSKPRQSQRFPGLGPALLSAHDHSPQNGS
jgi:hypothetical protein